MLLLRVIGINTGFLFFLIVSFSLSLSLACFIRGIKFFYSVDTVRALLEAGADIEAEDNQVFFLFHLFYQRFLFLRKKKLINSQIILICGFIPQGFLPLMYACSVPVLEHADVEVFFILFYFS